MPRHPVRHDAAAPIGVFDSGVGGLTVVAALRAALPQEQLLYLGDTARVPYGSKTPASVVRYAVQAASALVDRGVKALVVACNTASAVALAPLTREFAPLPVFGVIEPGASAAVAASATGRIAVIATEGTVRGGAYPAAIAARAPLATVVSAAAPLLVALAEEGWTEGEVVDAVLARYLDPLFAVATPPDALVLGCTHFPVFRHAIAARLGPAVRVVDSAATTAADVAAALASAGLARSAAAGAGPVRFLVTDGPARFARVGGVFLGAEVAPEAVELVDLAGVAGSTM
jgi:glutamate racemase